MNDTNTDTKRFNALCKVVIYHYCDCARKKGIKAATKLLIEQGVMEGEDDAEAAYAVYDALVCEHALGELPDGFSRQHDYWGAVCISNDHNWNAVKHDNPDGSRVFYAGDSQGRIMFFENFTALQEYTQEVVQRIEDCA